MDVEIRQGSYIIVLITDNNKQTGNKGAHRTCHAATLPSDVDEVHSVLNISCPVEVNY